MMKNLKNRFISFVSAVAVLATTLVGIGLPAFAAESPLGADAEGFLRYLNIVDQETPDYNKALTRGEMAHMAARVSNMMLDQSASKNYFYDVLPDHPYYKEINALVETGVISGDGNGYYRPEDIATSQEICKVFAVILGYDEIGQIETFPKVANRAGITEGVTFSGDLTYGQAMQVAYNTLHAPMLDTTVYGDHTTYQERSDYLALECYHGLVKRTGIVDGVEGTTLEDPDETITKGLIRINGAFYEYADVSALGKKVIFYVEKNNTRKIAYLCEAFGENEIVVIPDKDIIGLVGSQTGISFEYYVGANKRSLRLADVDVIYNGIAHPDYTAEDLKPGSGSVTLIDNNSDNQFDVLLVDAEEYMMVNAIDTENGILYGKYPANSSVGSKNVETVYSVHSEMGDILFHHLIANDVIIVKNSKNTKGIRKADITLVADSLAGVIEAKNDDKITISGVEYTITSETILDGSDLLLGQTVNVYARNGKCVAILHPENDGYQFGYLLSATDTSKNPFEGKLEMKIVDKSRGLNRWEAAKVINIDEVPYRSAVKTNEIITLLTGTASRQVLKTAAEGGTLTDTVKASMQGGRDQHPLSQAIRYRLSSDGLLTHIDTVQKNANETEDSLQAYSPSGFRDASGNPAVETIRGTYWTGNNGLYSSTSGDNLRYFSFSNKENIINVSQSERGLVEWYPGTDLLKTNGTGDRILEMYTVDPEYKVGRYIITYSPVERKVSTDLTPYILTSVEKAMNAEGDVETRLTVLNPAGKTATYPVANDVAIAGDCSLETLAIGDIIRIEKNMAGKVAAMDRAFSIEKPENKLTADERLYAKHGNSNLPPKMFMHQRYIYGTLLSRDGDFLSHTGSVQSDPGSGVENMENKELYLMNASTLVFAYENVAGKPQVKISGTNELQYYNTDKDMTQRTILVTQTGSLKYIYIIDRGVE